jgi:c-di-GMP-binding flagellar brake protein YcgR
MTSEANNSMKERRHFPRVQAPIFCRPAGFLKARHRIGNVSLGGLRIYSDQLYKSEDRLEIEIFLPDNQSVVEIVRVVWIKELPPNSEALYDVGLEFIRLSPQDAQKLQLVLDNADPQR